MLLKRVVMSQEEHESFYQYKFERLSGINKWVIIVSCILEALFFGFDCIFESAFSWNTLIPRFFIIIPLIAFLVINKKISSYKIMVPFSYIMIHTCMWTTIWAAAYMTNTSYANETFLAMHLMFLAVGLCAPSSTHIFYHAITLVNILVSSLFIKYDNLLWMIAVAVICIIAVWMIEFVVENFLSQQFMTEKKMEEMTRKDQLTGAYNRKQMPKLCIDESAELIYKNAGIILIDIDNFKDINERITHEGGDKLLIELFNIINVCIRGNDCCIRWGGDQFVIIVPNQGLARTKDIAERIRNRVNDTENVSEKFHVSIGTAVYKGGDYYPTINEAEKALTFAKENGRNMVIAYEDMNCNIPE